MGGGGEVKCPSLAEQNSGTMHLFPSRVFNAIIAQRIFYNFESWEEGKRTMWMWIGIAVIIALIVLFFVVRRRG